MILNIILLVIGFVILIKGANWFVGGATLIAHQVGVSQRLISLTVVAFGTSLPELVTSVTASIKGEYDIAIGNIVGSNIFNIGVVLGLPVMLFGGIVAVNFNYLDIFVMLLAVVLLFIYSFIDKKIRCSEGLSLLVLFFIYYIYIIFL